MKRAFVLLSGGLDSATCLAEAVNKLGNKLVTTVSFLYGQKHTKELECARNLSEYYDVEHHELNLTDIFSKSNCSLLSHSSDKVPEGTYESQLKSSNSKIVSTYVPFRNGLMLSAVASFSMSLYPDDRIELYLGNHRDDSSLDAYPDCSEDFSEFISRAIFIGTSGHVKTYSPYVNLTKAEVVKRGLELNVPYELTWSCYEGGETPCGKCGTCIDRTNAFRLNNVEDPLLK